MSNSLMIAHITADIHDGETVFWNNEYGWVESFDQADRFDTADYNLPIGKHPEWFEVSGPFNKVSTPFGYPTGHYSNTYVEHTLTGRIIVITSFIERRRHVIDIHHNPTKDPVRKSWRAAVVYAVRYLLEKHYANAIDLDMDVPPHP